MIDLDKLTSNYRNHADVDYVGLWQIASRVQDEIGSQDQKSIRYHVIEIIRRLMSREVYPGDYTRDGFTFWSGTRDEFVNRIENKWSSMGLNPDLAEPICWFALRSPETI